MTISITSVNHHWNYFLSLERDLDVLSRYIEFCPENLQVFSIELAHLLFAAASEIDVIAKRMCSLVEPMARSENIDHYRSILVTNMPLLPETQVELPRYGLKLSPWLRWNEGRSPEWWRSYNRVKHERDAHFNEATLENALNALGGLFVLNFHFFWLKLKIPGKFVPGPQDAMAQLQPSPSLMRVAGAF